MILGLVIGSIRSLILERAKAKIDARMTEIGREKVLEKIDDHKRVVTVGLWQKIEFVHSGLSELERREQEFNSTSTNILRTGLGPLTSNRLGCLCHSYSVPSGAVHFLSRLHEIGTSSIFIP